MSSPWRNRIVGSGEEAPDQLVANPLNWRTHPGSQRAALRGSLGTVGWVQQVMVNQRTGNVVDGHARVEEAISRQEASVPVLYVDLEPDEERLVLASLDPIAAMAQRDDDRLRDLLADLEVDDPGLQALLDSLETKEPKVGLTDPDDAPDLGDGSNIQRGDLFALGDHRLMCGDSTDQGDVARLYGQDRAALVFTDPPWNVDYQGGSKKREALANDHIEVGWDDWLTTALAALPTATDAPAYVFFGLMRAGDTQHGIEAAGWRIVQTLVWVKQHAQFGNFRAHYKYQHEPLYYCSTGTKVPEWYGPNNAVSVWNVDRSMRNDFHPTQKPVELAERAMGHSSKSGAVVGEPFSGSGSTIIAAERLGRRAYGMEIDPRYVAVALERWENFTGRKAERIDGAAA
jgi:DNA modification methylase